MNIIITKIYLLKNSVLTLGFLEDTKLSSDSEILVGRKPQMSYVLACITAFHKGIDEIIIKARGRSISKAVDVAQIVRKKFMPDVIIKDITIGTDEIKLEETQEVKKVSSINIVLRRTKK
jgi:DNA-binding protein